MAKDTIKIKTIGDHAFFYLPTDHLTLIQRFKLAVCIALKVSALKNGLNYNELLEQFIVSLKYVEQTGILDLIYIDKDGNSKIKRSYNIDGR